MRKFIAKYGVYLASACIVLAAFYYVTFGKNNRLGTTALAFYVDENNLADETVRPATDIPPITRDGKTYVEAVKRSNDGGKHAYIAFLRKFSPEVHDELVKLTDPSDPNRARLVERGMLIRAPQPGSPWIPINDPEGKAAEIIAAKTAANGNLPIQIFPSR